MRAAFREWLTIDPGLRSRGGVVLQAYHARAAVFAGLPLVHLGHIWEGKMGSPRLV